MMKNARTTTQEVLRALIDRTEYLDNVIHCTETQDAIWHLRMALFCYEARAYRRKQEGKNRQKPEHDDTMRPKPWNEIHFMMFLSMNKELRKDLSVKTDTSF